MSSPHVFFWALIAICSGCGSTPPPSRTVPRLGNTRSGERLLVVAPHPDDEILMAAGRIAHTLADGGEVRVVVMTNGDYLCQWSGYARERETLAALADIGVDGGHVSFLGYPDGFLDSLTEAPIAVQVQSRERSCVTRSNAYNQNGERSQAYTRANAITDLHNQLASFRPTDIVVTHALDAHPDHATTNTLLRAALTHAQQSVNLHQVIVHAGHCYPGNLTGTQCTLPFLGEFAQQDTPPLPDDAPYNTLPTATRVPYAQTSTWPPPKASLIEHFQTQLSSDRDWLYAFARRDEVFFDERFVTE